LRDSIGKIDVASNHLLGVINDILDISKIEAGKLELDQSAFDFYSMIDQTLSVVGFRIDERKIHFVQNLDKSIPRFLKGDGQRISQVITNLLSNAVKFTPERGTVTLETAMAWCTEEECSFRVCVRDTGIGISDEQLKRLFNAFEQADNSTSRRFGGTGLGLAISREIIELMGGRIWAESELGQGSSFTFEITLPLSTEREMPLEEPSRFDKESMHGCFRDYHILIAEDIEINREIVLALLEDTGINIDIALNGREEVEMFAANHERYDLIFSDVQMPEMDGYEAVRIIRGMDVPSARTIPIIAMTANVFKEDVLRAREAGMDSHIGKPLVQKDLLSKLVRYLPDVPKSRERDEAMAPSL
jgi:CheY-like chemotaxis protein